LVSLMLVRTIGRSRLCLVKRTPLRVPNVKHLVAPVLPLLAPASRKSSLVYIQKRYYSDQKRTMVTSVRHGKVEGEIYVHMVKKLPKGFDVSLGEAGYFDGAVVRGADVMVYEKEKLKEDQSSLAETPYLLVEVMSPSNLTPAGLVEISQKVNTALQRQTKVVWLIFIEKVKRGVQVHKEKYVDSPLLTGDTKLDDAGLGFQLTPNLILSNL